MPVDPPDVVMSDQDRLLRLEEAAHTQASYNTTIQESLDKIFRKLNEITVPEATADPATLAPPPQPPAEHPPPIAKDSRLKPSPPMDFDGDRTKGQTFLNQCELYFGLRPSDFDTDQVKINWTLSFMKSGRAAAFADRVISYQTEKGKARYYGWSAFRSAFVETFCPLNESTMAIVQLESEGYYQGRRGVDEYIDEFEELVRKSGYEDDKVKVIKFRKGLNSRIQNAIAESGDNRPADDEPDAWYRAARLLDQNRQANDAFRGSFATKATVSNPANPRPSTGKSLFSFPAPPKFPAPTPRPLPPAVPMEIDASKSKSAPQTCYRCGSPDHFSRNCPRKFDVRYMLVEEKREWIQNLLAAEDAVTDEAAAEESAEAAEEDFTPRSG